MGYSINGIFNDRVGSIPLRDMTVKLLNTKGCKLKSSELATMVILVL